MLRVAHRMLTASASRNASTALVGVAFRRNNAYSGYQTDSALAAELGRRLMGLGFLDLLLPPARTDLSEICIYSSGLVQVMKKNSVRWETLPDLKPGSGRDQPGAGSPPGAAEQEPERSQPHGQRQASGHAAQPWRRPRQSAAPGHRPARAQPEHQYPPVRAEAGPARVDPGAAR